jgi:DNA modification methylase
MADVRSDWSGGVLSATVLVGDCIEQMRTLPDGSVNCCVTSPPYLWLRDYGHAGQIGLEPTPDAYVAKMVEVFREVRRVLQDDGTLWLNLGDSYSGSWGAQSRSDGDGGMSADQVAAHPKKTRTGSLDKTPGLKPKDILGIPWRVAFALQADGWWLRQDIIWHKPNPMPESVTDRCTKAHEYIFLLAKAERYWFDAEAIAEKAITAGTMQSFSSPGKAARAIGVGQSGNEKPGAAAVIVKDRRNRRSVWTVTTQPYKDAHFATYPPKLIEPCILAGCPAGGTVLDPFLGSGTTAAVAIRHGRNAIGCELNHEYARMAERRIAEARADVGLFADAVPARQSDTCKARETT